MYLNLSVRLNDCVCCAIGNLIGDDGVRDIAEALKVNTTLADVNLTGMNIFWVFSMHLSPIRVQKL